MVMCEVTCVEECEVTCDTLQYNVMPHATL